MTEPIALFFLLLWFYLLLLPKLRTRRGDYLVGMVGGLFYLTRYNALLFLPLVALLWGLQRRSHGWGQVRLGLGFLVTALACPEHPSFGNLFPAEI